MTRTPEYLVPRMGDLPVSNARYFRTAVITRVTQAPREVGPETVWTSDGRILTGGGHPTTAMAVHPDGTRLATADASGTVRLWDLEARTAAVPPLTGHTAAVTTVSFNADGSVLVTADTAGNALLWDTATGAALGRLPDGTGVAGAVFVAGDRLLVGPRVGRMAVLRLADDYSVAGRDSLVEVPDGEYTAVAGSLVPDGLLLAVAGPGRNLAFTHPGGSGKPVPVESRDRPREALTVVAYRLDGSLVATATQDGSVRMWESRTGQAIGIEWSAHTGPVTALAWSPNGALLVSAGLDGLVAVWDPSVGGVAVLTAPGARLRAVAFAPDGGTVIAADGEGSVWAWSDGSGEVVAPLAMPRPGSVDDGARPAEGVLLTHEQSWIVQGTALGELLHSVSLAPGEVTQVAVAGHTRRLLQNSVDTASQEESLRQAGASGGELTEHERTSASESDAGGSFALSAGADFSAGLGGVAGGFGVSAGTSTSLATGLTASFSTGTRGIADESNQSVHQNSTEAARLSRQRYTASVREVSETDSVELQTRVVANYNHMHALTMQYFEVIQVQRLQTRVTDAHRLLFVPMRLVRFADPDECDAALRRFRREIVDTTRAMGLTAVADCIDLLMMGAELGDDLRNLRIARVWSRERELHTALGTAVTADETARLREVTVGDAVLAARDALRAADDPGLAARAALQRSLQAAIQDAATASAAADAASTTVSRLRTAAVAARRDRDRLAAILGVVPPPDGPATPPPPPELDGAAYAALVGRVREALGGRAVELNQGLWMRLDPSTYSAMLESTAHRGERVSETLDPTPVAVAGNFVGFRWHHGDPAEAERFRREHVDAVPLLEDAVPLPTGGVFGEAVLGESNSAEKLDITRFWNWNDALPPIRPAEIGPIGAPESDAPAVPTRPDVPAAAINLGPITFPDVASGIPAIAAATGNAELFGDLSGAKTSAALARSAVELTAKGAEGAARLAGENFRRHLKFQRAMAKVALDTLDDGGARAEPDATMAGAVLNAGGGTPAERALADEPAGAPWDGGPTDGSGPTNGTGGASGPGSGGAGTGGVGAEDGPGHGPGGRSVPQVRFVDDGPIAPEPEPATDEEPPGAP